MRVHLAAQFSKESSEQVRSVNVNPRTKMTEHSNRMASNIQLRSNDLENKTPPFSRSVWKHLALLGK